MSSAATVDDTAETFRFGSTQIFERHWRSADPRFVLVIAHGGGEHSDYWTDVAHAMAAFGATSVGADFPGHGRSGGAMVSSFIDAYVDVLEHVVDRARGRHPHLPIVLFGHSMGGLVATRLAQSRRHTIDTLVLHAPALVALSQREPSDVPAGELTPDPALQKRIADDPYRMTQAPSPDQVEEALRELARGAAAARTAGPLAADLPLVWMHGVRDTAVPFDGAHRAFAEIASNRALFLGYPERGHGGLLESHPEEMTRDLGAAVGFALGW